MKKNSPSIFRRASRTVAALTLLGGMTGAATLATVSAAHATPSFHIADAGQQPWDHLVGFDNYGYGSRNLHVETFNGSVVNGVGQSVWIGAQDSVSGVWYGASGPTPGSKPISDSNGRIDTTIKGIPRSSCGHQFLIAATDMRTGIGDQTTVVDDCAPALALYSGHIVRGDGFTPGGRVKVYKNGVLWKKVKATKFALHLSPQPPTPQGTISAGDAGTGCVRVDAYDVKSRTWVSPLPGSTSNTFGSEFPTC